MEKKSSTDDDNVSKRQQKGYKEESYLRAIHDFIEKSKICCFSVQPDNIIMWGHYAHEYDVEKLEKNGKEHFHVKTINHAGVVVSFSPDEELWPMGTFHEIDYKPTRIQIPTTDKDIEKYAYNLMCRKYNKWNYENERRLIIPNMESDFLPFNTNAVKAIHLGLNISDAHCEEIVRIRDSKYQGVPILKARKSDEEYELIFDKQL